MSGSTKEIAPSRRLRIWHGRFVKAQFQFEPRDVWVGLFWRTTDVCVHLYVTVVPLCPLHVTIMRKKFRRALVFPRRDRGFPGVRPTRPAPPMPPRRKVD